MIIAGLVPALVTASEPPVVNEPPGINRVRRGPSLLDSLKSRSPSRRWDLLDKTVGPVRPLITSDSKSSTRAAESTRTAPMILPNGTVPDAAEPFPGRQPKNQSLPPTIGLQQPVPLKNSNQKAASKDVSDRILTDPNPVTLLLPVVMQKRQPKPLKLRQLTDISPFPDYRPPDFVPGKKGDLEPEKTWKDEQYQPREFSNLMFNWEASNLWHNPVYFEDVPLERYGHTYHELVQPFASIKLFTAQLLGLPYQMAIDPIHKRIYTLGWYRPGEGCVPRLCYLVPWNSKAAVIEAGVMTGLFFLIP